MATGFAAKGSGFRTIVGDFMGAEQQDETGQGVESEADGEESAVDTALDNLEEEWSTIGGVCFSVESQVLLVKSQVQLVESHELLVNKHRCC